MPPRKTIAKEEPTARGPAKASKAKEKAAAASDRPSYWLYLQTEDGKVFSSTHTSANAVVNTVWSWGNKHELCLCSSDWDLKHPRYGWQDAHNLMITDEDCVGDDDELRGFWSTCFNKCMSSAKQSFEGEGEGAKICCYTNAARVPFWSKTQPAGD